MAETKIQWTDKVWNCIRGCTRVSRGCANCYAERQAIRQCAEGKPYNGLVAITNGRPRWTGKIQCDDTKLLEPLSWRKPSMIFVNSMSDLFHEDVPFTFIDKVYTVIGLAKKHQFQILTKRPHRAFEYFLSRNWDWAIKHFVHLPGMDVAGEWTRRGIERAWNGASIEDQKTADDRRGYVIHFPGIPWVSVEPLLGPINFKGWSVERWVVRESPKDMKSRPDDYECAIRWVVIGGESGPRARPCNVEWIRDIVKDCKVAGIPVFVKQLGARPFLHKVQSGSVNLPGGSMTYQSLEVESSISLNDRKGGDPAEWPEDLRVREYPEVRA